MRIGILGGTFDPPHKGHLALAEAAVKQLKLDALYFVPAFIPPLKKDHRLTDVRYRLEMVGCLIKGHPKFKMSDCEIKRGGISYTVDTLRVFRKEYPTPHELFFITGGDWGRDLDQWKEINEIFSLAHFVVARRPGFNTENLRHEVEFLDFIPLDVSSTGLRERLKKQETQIEEIPENVLNYILKNKLYSK